jgi:hypothetical protein
LRICAPPFTPPFSVACGIYLLNSLPSVLFPSGVLASVLTLLLGMLLGLAGAAAALVSAALAPFGSISCCRWLCLSHIRGHLSARPKMATVTLSAGVGILPLDPPQGWGVSQPRPTPAAAAYERSPAEACVFSWIRQHTHGAGAHAAPCHCHQRRVQRHCLHSPDVAVAALGDRGQLAADVRPRAGTVPRVGGQRGAGHARAAPPEPPPGRKAALARPRQG